MKRKINNPRQRNITSTALICIVCIVFLSFLTPGYSHYNYEQVSINNPPKSSQISSTIPFKQQWNTTWGGVGDDSGLTVVVDSSENIYLSGSTTNFGTGGEDVALIKYNNLGEQQWNRSWGESDHEVRQVGEGQGVGDGHVPTPDGDVVGHHDRELHTAAR